jgi:Methyltransferase domain
VADPYLPAEVAPGDALWPVVERYRGSFPLGPVSYGTARDFADSADRMPNLISANGDMKDLQRCWMVKAILGNVEPGARILEIGAGEPLVAAMLSRFGYRVTVVDPYDGSDDGPTQLEDFRSFYPDLEFVRARFPAPDLDRDYSCIYSVSVLEHVPVEEIDAVAAAIREHLAAGSSCSIHAVDHVIAGWGADAHRERLRRWVAALGLPETLLTEQLAGIESDPETYLVSAEAHNRWRGDLPYGDYPMRRIASVQLFSRP